MTVPKASRRTYWAVPVTVMGLEYVETLEQYAASGGPVIVGLTPVSSLELEEFEHPMVKRKDVSAIAAARIRVPSVF